MAEGAYTGGELVGRLRVELNDVGGAIWSDAELHDALWRATSELSGYYPQPEDQNVDVALNATVFALASNSAALGCRLLAVIAVELPIGTRIPDEAFDVPRFGRLATSASQQAYHWRMPELYLRLPATGVQVGPGRLRLYLQRTFSYFDTTSSPELTFNGDAFDVELLYLLAQREALLMLAIQQGKTAVPFIHEVLVDLEVQITAAREARGARR